ncbi:hypothetical protein C1645_842113 [Glomus cerebriforme]|uniref:Uncharacterized protein n=1 Tax=Glomus cerebriforme TaxID=658196 RepID=A0A397S999_9GLOM|nr:hypothetical protein C1645_842113 [Glomus cerebriforme]
MISFVSRRPILKTNTVKLNELDNNNPYKKEIQHFKNEIELHLIEQSDLINEQIILASSLRQSKSRMNCLRRGLLDVQCERDNICKELANERKTFAKEEQDRKAGQINKQAHNFLETLREAVDAEDDIQDDEEGEETFLYLVFGTGQLLAEQGIVKRAMKIASNSTLVDEGQLRIWQQKRKSGLFSQCPL